jgi:hypothetical protein
MLQAFSEALDGVADGAEPLVLELTTFGGDADLARRMATDVQLFRERSGRRTIFLGRTTVYSSGVTVMAGFPPGDRWLTRDATLLIHGRSLLKTLEISGALAVERLRVLALLSEIEAGLALEREDFERLIEGSRIDLTEVLERAPANWYLRAPEALARGLVAGIV